MSRTDFQAEILVIAHRVIAERESGRSVDPLRLQWAEAIVRANAPPQPAPARAFSP